MMKFVAVFLVAAVFAVSVVDARHHGLVKRDANCVLSAIDPVDALLSVILDTVNVLKSGVLQTLKALVNFALQGLGFILFIVGNKCLSDLLAEIKALPQFLIDSVDGCITEVIDNAKATLHTLLDEAEDNLELLCFLQECVGTGLVSCITTLGVVIATVGQLPAAVVAILAAVLETLDNVLAGVDECLSGLPALLVGQLKVLIDAVWHCIFNFK